MENHIFTRTFFFCIIAAVVFISYLYIADLFNHETTVVFCDVGQGDGTYMRVKNQIDILIDAGPDNKILNCLSHHMPFWDHTIELAFLSHPQKDHYGGYISVLDHYKIANFFESPVQTQSKTYEKLHKKLTSTQTSVRGIYRNTTLSLGEAQITVLWPTREFVYSTYKAPMDLNSLSQILIFSQNSTRILFTGDIYGSLVEDYIIPVTILKVPHHGSRNGLTKRFLSLAHPAIAVISVGRNNSYGHPARSVLAMLQALGTAIKRTDREKDIIFTIK